MELNNSPYKRVKHRLQTPTLAKKFHFSHWFPGGADGRTYGHVIIKVSRMDRLQNLWGIWNMGLRAHIEPAMNANANAEWYCLFRVIHIHVQHVVMRFS